MVLETNVLIIGGMSGIALGIMSISMLFGLGKKADAKVPVPAATSVVAKESPTQNPAIPLAAEEPMFTISADQPIPTLPEVKDVKLLDIKYPLIPPYAYARVHWDAPNNEIVYEIEEPQLDGKEQETLKVLEDGIRELINLSYISVKDQKTVLIYLEKNIRILLTELAIDLSTESYLKIMYYIYRDFVGLNELEPLMNDYYIEDVECNGLNTPVYIVHRKFRNIRTSLVYKDIHSMAGFVEKLAQKCGKYVSYAEPLLDGSLPDGSRVNATYSTDVSSRGPTMTIRKFVKEPWSPITLMQKGSVTAEILAYLWMVIEYENSFMVIGGTGTGKCVTGDTPVYLADGAVKKISNIVEERFEQGSVRSQDGWEYVAGDGTRVLSMHKEDLKIINVRVNKFWRHKAPRVLIRIKTRSGREIRTTPEHPFFLMKDGCVEKIRADQLMQEQRIAVPRAMQLDNKFRAVDLKEYLKNRKDVYVAGVCRDITTTIRIIKKREGKSEEQIAREIGVAAKTLNEWKRKNAIPARRYYELLAMAGSEGRKELIVKGKTARKSIRVPRMSPDLYKFAAYVIADGHLTRTNIQFNNTNKTLRAEFKRLGEKIWGIKGYEEFPKDRTPKIVFYSQPSAAVLHEAFAIPYGNKARTVKVPESLYFQDDRTIAGFVRAIADCESSIGKTEIEISTTSKELAEGIPRLLGRLGIMFYLVTRKDHYRVYVSGTQNLRSYQEGVGYVHPRKARELMRLVNRRMSKSISNVDLLPGISNLVRGAREALGLTQNQLAVNMNVSRRMVGMIEDGDRMPSIHTFKAFNEYIEDTSLGLGLKQRIGALAESDIFWDEVVEVERLADHGEEYVYDLTVDEHHNFLAGNIPIVAHNTSFLNAAAFFMPPQARIVTIEDTRELKLEHENWLPSVARAGAGVATAAGTKYGEVTLFDLLRASFRQRPDYIIVGEVRGAEAYVLFQAFASIRGDEEVFVIDGNRPLLIKIRDLERYNIKKLKVLSYNWEEKKCEVVTLKGWVKHPRRDLLYKITTKSGREVTMTKDHSVFTYENGTLMPVRGEDLCIGSKIMIPAYVECGYNNIAQLNLLEYLPDVRIFAPEYVRAASYQLGFYGANRVINCASITDYYSETEWSKPNALKAEKFLKLMREAGIAYKLEDLQVKFAGMSERCSVFLDVSDEFLRFVGYYLSEGSLHTSRRNYRIALYNKDQRVLADMERCMRRVVKKEPWKRVTDRGWGEATELACSHKVMYEFLKRYGKTKTEKRVPAFIFGLDKKRIGGFLSALYTGDGTVRAKGVTYYTTSRALAHDVTQLLLVFGIVATVAKRNRKGRKTTDYEVSFYAKYKMEEFLRYVKPIGKNVQVRGRGRVDKNMVNQLYCDTIKSIEMVHLDKPEYVYDLAVEKNQNFIGGFGGILLHNSGHPGTATMHAENVETMVRRLQTPPINLSGSLVMTLAAVIVLQQTRIHGKEMRKASSVDEIVDVKELNVGGQVVTNNVFKWNPANDTVAFNPNSRVFQNIVEHYGLTKEQVLNEFNMRARLLKELYRRGIINYKEVQVVIHQYYKNPDEVLKKFGLAK